MPGHPAFCSRAQSLGFLRGRATGSGYTPEPVGPARGAAISPLTADQLTTLYDSNSLVKRALRTPLVS
jgi:hypothetical protein